MISRSGVITCERWNMVKSNIYFKFGHYELRTDAIEIPY